MSGDPVAVMIDDPSTRDLDDAISVEPLPEGGWQAVVYIAGVAAAVTPGSLTDRVARKRVMSVYRPTKVVPMLGDRVERAATLAVDADREVLAVTMLFAPDGERLGAARVERRIAAAGSCVRLAYADVPAVADNPAHRCHQTVQATHALASALRARRSAAGALVFYDLTRGYASTEDGKIALIPLGQRTIGYVMVAELMIAASAAVADWCVDHDVPILFRNHRTSLLTADGADVATDIAASVHDTELFEQLRQRVNHSFGKAVYDAVPRGHHALRLPVYAHVTSPLRRYPDLVSQQMVWAHLQGARAPYSHQQLAAIAEEVNGYLAARQSRRDEFFLQQRRQQALASITGRNFTVLDAEQWRQVFDVMTRNDPVDGIDAEMLRRLDAQLLGPNDVARMAAAGPAWTPVRMRVFPAVRARHPEFGPSAVSGRAQILGQDPTAVDVEVIDDPAPRSGPRFAARAVFDGRAGRWQVASSKKAAAAQAMWELLDVLCGHSESVEAPFSWAEYPDTAAVEERPLTSCAETADVSGLSEAMTRYLRGLGPGPRARAMANPVPWLTSTAAHLRIDPFGVDYQMAGPAHAPVFTCTVTVAGVSHRGAAASKGQARAAAAGDLLAAMLAAVPYSGDAGPSPVALAVPSNGAANGAAAAEDELTDAARHHLQALTGAQRDKATKNPGAWVNNFAAAFGLRGPTYDYTSEGPSHAQVFTCTASLAGLRSVGSGATKSASRTSAAEALLAVLLADSEAIVR